MFESLILGAIQGITEWLPVSSEGMLVLAQVHLFDQSSLSDALHMALFLHLGTFLAALVYLWPQVRRIGKNLFRYKKTTINNRREIRFYVIVTIISGLLGFGFIKLIEQFEQVFLVSAQIITIVIGILLLITAGLHFLSKRAGVSKTVENANLLDGILLGITQSLAALPGISRSGSTVAVLLLRKFRESDALVMSFLMGLPIVLGGNIILNFDAVFFTKESLVALLASFIFGLITIDLLLKLARKMQFAWFTGIFGILTIIAGILI